MEKFKSIYHISSLATDVQLNSTMRLIFGTLRSTPLPWLPVLSKIEPPALRRKAATDKLVEKIVKHDSWPIQPELLPEIFINNKFFTFNDEIHKYKIKSNIHLYQSTILLQDLDQWVTKPLYCGMNSLWL